MLPRLLLPIAVVIGLLLGISLSGKTQTATQTLALANQYLANGHYKQAILYYQRVIFFDQTETLAPHCYANMAFCYQQTRQWAKAAEFYSYALYTVTGNNANNNTAITPLNDSLAFELKLLKIACLLYDAQHKAAMIELLDYNEASLTPAQQHRYWLYMATGYYAADDITKAKTYFIKALPNAADSVKVDVLFGKLIKANKKREGTAMLLSIILPGTGQLYAGDVRNALNSFLLTSGWLALAINTGINTGGISAVITIVPWYARYYMGGLTNAATAVKNYKLKKKDQIHRQVLKLYH